MSKVPIPYGRQEITEEDIRAVTEVLKSDYLTQGPTVERFEGNFNKHVNSRYSVAVSNGTAALHLAAKVLGVKKGVKVVSSPLTFAASTNSVLYNGGEVILCDIDEDAGLIDLDLLKALVDGDPDIQGVIPVDYAGYPVDTERVRQIMGTKRWILEDACHAPGAWRHDSKGDKVFAGSNNYTNSTIFSFHPVKHIAAGEGGMITCHSEHHYQELKELRTHGITKDPAKMRDNDGGWYYEMQSLGYNYRLTDVQAALGNSQLSRLEDSVKKRNVIADRYDMALANLPLQLPSRPISGLHAFHLYVIKTDRRKELFDFLRNHQIFAQVHYVPVHLHPYYQNLGVKKGMFPKAESFYNQCLSLPNYPSMTEDQQSYVIEKLTMFFK